MVKIRSSRSPVLPELVSTRPMVMLTGFLGAGKTTFLRSLLRSLGRTGHRADVILNDRENASIDRETLRDDAETVAALTGSCVCCEGLEELSSLLLDASRRKHDVLFLELNGTADPVPLQETFVLFEKHLRLHPRWQVCLVDARFFGKRRSFADLEALQLETASHFVISHADEMASEDLESLLKKVRTINPRASRTSVEALTTEIASAIERGGPSLVAGREADRDCGSPLFSRNRPELHEKHRVAHEFTGCNIIFPDLVDEAGIFPWLQALPDGIIRVKVLLQLAGESGGRFLYERVSGKVSDHPIPVREVAQVPCSGIFIGPSLDPEEILRITRDQLSPQAHFPTS